MLKFLPFIIVIVVLGGFLYFRYFSSPSTPTPASESRTTTALPIIPPFKPSTSSSSEDRVEVLEKALTILTGKVNELSLSKPSSETERRLKTLENNLIALQKQVNSLPAGSNEVSQLSLTSTKKPPVYIPLGSSTSTTDKNYNSFDNFEVSIDPGDYQGYTSMSLEVNIKMAQAIGTGYASLYNYTDKSTISGSEGSSTSTTYSLASSGGFTLPNGRKIYRLQAKSSEGTEIYLQNARIKVNF